jgi:hypothetical protein
VLLEVLLGGSDELEGNELEAAVLEARDDRGNEAALNTVRLDGNEATRKLVSLQQEGGVCSAHGNKHHSWRMAG